MKNRTVFFRRSARSALHRRFPSLSNADSVDWKKPSAADIKKKVLKGVKPGSILLFHNDLENTTEALPEILTNLKSQGFEFVTVGELIYKDNYTIDANGRQLPTAEGALTLPDEEVEEVMSQYSDLFETFGLTEEQIAQAEEALKSGDLSTLPENVRPFALEVMARASENTSDTTSGSRNIDTEPTNSDITDK